MTQDDSSFDPFLEELLQNYNEEESIEIQQYLQEWDAATYISVAQSILDHASRKEIDSLKYLRKAYNFNTKRAKRIPKTGYRWDGSAVYRRRNEYLIVRPDQFGFERIITYGVNDE